nr:MAG TPA: hypothetical protein [Caudoviricetes sp.]
MASGSEAYGRINAKRKKGGNGKSKKPKASKNPLKGKDPKNLLRK